MLLFRPPLLKFGRTGVRAADIAVGGDEDSPLYNDFTFPADNESIALWALLTPLLDNTSNGATTVDDQGGYAHVDPDDGTWEQDYRLLWMPPTGAPGAQDGTITISVGGGGAVSLVIQDSTHSHAADGLTLTTASVLAIADAQHAHAADSATLTVGSVLAVVDAAHGHAADSLTLTTDTGTTLVAQDAAHAHAAEAPTLTVAAVLAVADALHAHLADVVVLVIPGLLPDPAAHHLYTAPTEVRRLDPMESRTLTLTETRIWSAT